MTGRHLKIYKYVLDDFRELDIFIRYEKNVSGITHIERLTKGGFIPDDFETCGSPIKRSKFKPRYLIYNYGTLLSPINLITICRTKLVFDTILFLEPERIKRFFRGEGNIFEINRLVN